MASEGDLSAIEADFVASWDETEQFFVEFENRGHERLKSLLELIRKLREQGYDRDFRAGHTIFTFNLSRSLKNGLHPEQSIITIDVQQDGNLVVSCMTFRDVVPPKLEEVITIPNPEVTPELEALLARLRAHPID